MKPGKRNDITDVPGLTVGNAQDETLKSGTTIVLGDSPMVASVAVLGGAPGTRETDLLEADKLAPAVDAIVLSGGSAFGLDAATGVMAGLREQGRGFEVGPVRVPIVPAAILFDLLNGGDKGWKNSPYPALGRAALEACSQDLSLGSVGAGTGATTGQLKGGLGSASFVLDSGHTVAALMAANPVGNVTTEGGRHFWAAPFEQGEEFGGLGPDPRSGLTDGGLSLKLAANHTNTTIGIVATDAPLTKAQAKRLAVAAHDGMARAIVPSHTPFDGDLIFACSTATQGATDDALLVELGHAASLCVARAIARGIYEASEAPGDLLPTWRAKNA